MIDQENWTFCQYNSLELKAFISIAGEPSDQDEVSFLYNVTVTDHENLEIFQLTFPDLALAVTEINKKYRHWDFNNLTVTSSDKSDDGGCGSCSAH
jgi:hypothetical protein